VVAGFVSIKVYHTNFPARFAIAPFKFKYKQVGLPSVDEDGIIGTAKDGKELIGKVQMHETTEVTITVQSAPVNAVGPGDVSITMTTAVGTVSIPVSFLNVVAGADGKNAVGIIKCIFPVSSGSGANSVKIVFLNSDILRTTFTITYYNNYLPQLISVQPSTGRNSGNTVIVLRISNFPILITSADVSVTFGAGDVFLPVQSSFIKVLESTDSVALLQILTPAYAALTSGFARLPVTVAPTAQTNLVAASNFEYFVPPVVLVRENLVTRGPDTGGTRVQLVIENFPAGSSAGDITVVFGDIEVGADSINVAFSSIDKTVFDVIAPGTAAPGSFTVDVKVSPTSQVGSTPQLGFVFSYFDSRAPQIRTPPIRGCSEKAHDVLLSVAFLGASTSKSDISLEVHGQSIAISCMNEDSCLKRGDLSQMKATVPQTNLPGPTTIAFKVAGKVIFTFPYELYDCSAPFFETVEPTKGVYTGGNILSVKIQRFPVSSGVEITFGGSTSEILDISDGGALGTTIIQFKTPAQVKAGDAVIKLSAGTRTVTKNFKTVSPCVFDTFCSSSNGLGAGGIADPRVIQGFSPTDDTCNVKYCVTDHLVPTPTIMALVPSSGTAAGGIVVELDVQNFAAMTMGDIEVFSTSTNPDVNSKSYGTVIQYTQTGDNIFTGKAKVTFTLPKSPVGGNMANLVFQIRFGAVIRITFKSFEYFLQPVGLAIIQQSTITSIMISERPSFLIDLTNLPLVKDLTATNLLTASFKGNSVTATKIFTSTRALTRASFQMPSLSGLTVGTPFDLTVFYTPHSIARAGTKSIAVKADPSPSVTSMFPAGGLSNTRHAIQARVQFLFSGASYTVTLVTANGKSVTLPQVGSPELTTNPSCLSASKFCTSVMLSFITPSENPDGVLVGGAANIRICAGSSCGVSTFNYVGQDSYIVDSINVTSAKSTVDTYVAINVRNLPNIDQASNVIVRLGSVSCLVRSFVRPVAPSTIWTLTTIFPANFIPAVIQGSVYRQADGSAAGAPFSFTFTEEAATFSPVDASTSESTLVQITLYWGLIVTSNDLSVEFDNIAGTIAEVLESSLSKTIVSVRTPTGTSVGLTYGSISASHVGTSQTTSVTRFSFQFFGALAISNIQPSLATLDGRVAPCSTCLFDEDAGQADKKHISIWIANFPATQSVADVKITIGTNVCTRTATNPLPCSVKRVLPLDNGGVKSLYVTVSVPIATVTGWVPIKAEFIGTTLLARSPKSAEKAQALRYYKPVPVMLSAQYCKTCNTGSACIVAGLCGGGELPVDGFKVEKALYTIQIPKEGGGKLTFTIGEFDKVDIDAISKLVANLNVLIGTTRATVTRVLSSNSKTLVFECTPSASATAGQVTGSVQLQPNAAVLFIQKSQFSVLLEDTTKVIKCVTNCAGSSASDTAGVSLQLNNFGLITSADQLIVAIGPSSAKEVVVVSSAQDDIGFVTYLTLKVPKCLACTFRAGASTQRIKVSLASDAAVFSSADFTFWSAPVIENALFTPQGQGLVITLGHASNSAGQVGKFPCSAVLIETGLGSGSECVWETSSILSVIFGNSPTILPRDNVALAQNKIKSANTLSAFSASTLIAVGNPWVPSAPGISSGKGPIKIDPCSAFSLTFDVPSPRNVQFTWRAVGVGVSDVSAINSYLSTLSTNALVLSSGTSQLGLPAGATSATWRISVFATDFLDAQSVVQTHELTKISTPAPQIMFFGRDFYLRTEVILLRGEAQFSECPVDKSGLIFKWTQDAGPAGAPIPPEKLAAAKSQLLIPALVLEGGSIYTVRLTVTIQATKASSFMTYNINVRSSPVSALISGGSSQVVRSSKNLVIDGSDSRDPDVAATASQGLTYAWTCSMVSGGYASPCTSAVDNTVLTLTSTPTITIKSGVLAASTVPRTFSLVVSKDSRTSRRSSMNVVVTAAPIPTLSVTHDITLYDSMGRAKINCLDRFRFSGASDMQNTVFSWTTSPALGSAGCPCANDVTVLPLGTTKDVFTAKPQMCTACNLLTQGTVYTVTLTGTFDGEVGRAQVELIINQAPVSGSCEACKVGSGGTTDVSCVQSGRALLDVFIMACRQWSDEDTPLIYQFGQNNGVTYDWFDPVPDASKSFKLPSGSVTLAARVIDNLGASSNVETSTVSINPMSGRRQLLATTADFDLVQDSVTADEQLGRADKVNQQASAASQELDKGGLSSISDSQKYKRQLINSVSNAKDLAAATSGLAAETSVATSSLTNSPCYLVPESLLTVVTTTSWAGQTLRATSTSATPLQTCENVLKSIDGATKATQSSECGSGASALTAEQANVYFVDSRKAIFQTMLSCVSQHVNGEAALSIDKFPASKTSALVSDPVGISSLTLAVTNGGNTGSFKMPVGLSSMLAGVEAGTELSFVTTQNLVLGNAGEAYQAEFVADSMHGLTVALKSAGTETAVKDLTKPIVVKIPFNLARAQAATEFWRQKINCNFLDTSLTPAKMNYDGCTLVSVESDHVLCNCTHLTDFSAGIDPNKPACGDGKLEDDEACDDGNTVSGDGCSAQCAVEYGHVCWAVPSVCCAPCQAGYKRTGCTVASARNTGSCVACEAGKYKGSTLLFSSTCSACQTDSSGKGNYSTVAAVICTEHGSCPIGQERAGHSINSAGTCTGCATGKYKDIVGIYTSICQQFTACEKGTYLFGYTASNRGTCADCDNGKYKPAKGYYSDLCKSCPPHTSTDQKTINDELSDCTCNSVLKTGTATIIGGWKKNATSDDSASYCADVNECTTNGHNCYASASCSNTLGSFTCSCNSGYDGTGTLCSTKCGDGLMWPCQGACDDNTLCDDGNLFKGDGCSETCTIETGFDCLGGNTVNQSDTCVCKAWSKVQGAGDAIVVAKYYTPVGDLTVEYPECSRYCSTAQAGPFTSFPGDSTAGAIIDKTCFSGTCNSADTKDKGFCLCNRYYFRADCNTYIPPDLGTYQKLLTNTSIDQTFASATGRSTVFFPANSLPAGFTAYMDVYSLAKLPDIASGLATGTLPFSDIVSLGPEGTTFSQPVALTLMIAAGSEPAAGRRFSINYFNKDRALWEEITTVHDKATGAMTCELEHFSVYAVLDVEVTHPPPPPPPRPPPPPPPPPAPPSPPPTIVVEEEPTAVPAPVKAPAPAPVSAPAEEGGSGLGAIIGGVVAALVILGGGYVFFIWYKRRPSAPIVPLRTGADGLEEPLLVAEVAEDQVATGVDSFVAVAEASPSSAETATMVAVPAAVAPGEPEPVVAEAAPSEEPLSGSALDELAGGSASTGLASGANFGFASVQTLVPTFSGP